MNQIQVTPQNIHAILASMDQHVANINERLQSVDAAAQALDNGDLVAAAKIILAHFRDLTYLELVAVQKQKEELEQIRSHMDSGIIIPK